jgi:alpha-L-fucosidase
MRIFFRSRALFLATIFALAPLGRSADQTSVKPDGESETKAQRDARMHWWREARFGMFIHWGIYSVPAGTYKGQQIKHIGEWIMHDAKIPVAEYKQYTNEFNPVNFDADRWVKTAKDAGMKYIVITSKHHDGFAMFHSAANPFNIYDATPFHRDPLKELAAACQKNGIKLGFYYSQAQDWTAPGGAAAGGHWDPAQDGSMDEYIKTKAVPQVREILSNYGPIAVLWWDTPIDMNEQRAAQFLPLMKLQPNIIVNNRLGGGFPGDTETPEQFIPSTGYPGRDWETCMTMNDTWGYKSWDHNWKSTETLLHNLINIASKGGNYLLNVGPSSLGEIPQPSIERLAQIGQWMRVNGDSIYATNASPFRKYSFDGRATVKGNRLYLQVFSWKDAAATVVGLKTKVLHATWLASGKPAQIVTDESGTLTIAAPENPDPIATVLALDLDGDPVVDNMSMAIKPQGDGSVALTAAEAGVLPGTDSGLAGSRFKYDKESDAIVGWSRGKQTLDWDFVSPAEGDYAVTITYACAADNAGTTFAVKVADSKVNSKVESTGDEKTFQTFSLGKVHVGSGLQTLSVVPGKMSKSTVMAFRSVELKKD